MAAIRVAKIGLVDGTLNHAALRWPPQLDLDAVNDQADRMRRFPLEFGHGLLERRRSMFLGTGHDESRVLRSEIGSSPAPEADRRRADVVGRRAPGKLECPVTRAQRILDEVRRLPTEERMDVLQGVVDLVAPTLSPEQEKGLVDAIAEADKGDLVDGVATFAKLRGRVRDEG